MPIDKQAKVVRPSGKHALHKFSVLDFQLFDPRTWAFFASENIYSSTTGKFHPFSDGRLQILHSFILLPQT
jgi:hypothetical protein